MKLRTRAVVGASAAAVVLSGIGASALAREREWPEVKTFVSLHSPPAEPSVEECTVTGTPAQDIKLDCDDPFPNDEPNVAVNPENGQNVVVSSNDFGSCCDQYYTTFNGGHTWFTGNMSHFGPNYTGSDPITVFDPKHNTAVHVSLNFKLSHGIPATNGKVVASVSTDGGRTWQIPKLVGRGAGARLFPDKEDATVDTNPASPFYGRIYVTWTGFLGDAKRVLESPIMISHSDDGGFAWSEPKEISGSNPRYCTHQENGPAGECDEDQGSAPRVGPDGVLRVAFENSQNTRSWEPGEQFEDQYMVVTSRDGGRSFGEPQHVVNLEDGTRDFPENVDGRQTLTGMQLRIPTFGTLAIDRHSGRSYITFTDNRAGRHDVDEPISHAEAYIVSSLDGRNWSKPVKADPDGNESWFPWVDVAANGTVGVTYNDRRGTGAYVAELAEGRPGAFSHQVVSKALSRPNDSRYFDALVAGCIFCATFHGDYLGLDYGSGNVANIAWTDMRDTAAEPVPGRGDHLQFVYFARR